MRSDRRKPFGKFEMYLDSSAIRAQKSEKLKGCEEEEDVGFTMSDEPLLQSLL